MANKVQYQIVGRYMDGKEVTGYHLQSIEAGKSGRYTKEQVAFLVGRGQVTNCQGQIYKDKLLLRGVGVQLDDLPVKQENGELSRTDGVGKVHKGASTADVMTQFLIVGTIVNGRSTVGYVIKNSGGQTKKIDRETTLNLAKSHKLGNARVQEQNGRTVLRGVGVNLNELPSMKVDSQQSDSKKQTKSRGKMLPSAEYALKQYKSEAKQDMAGLADFTKALNMALKSYGAELKNCWATISEDYSEDSGYYDVWMVASLGGCTGAVVLTTDTLLGYCSDSFLCQPSGSSELSRKLFSQYQNVPISFQGLSGKQTIDQIAQVIVKYLKGSSNQ